MRQFTDSEMDDLAAGWRRYKSEYETEPTHIWPFEHGFRIGLDHAAEQLAALTTANQELQFAFNLADETCRKLEAERDELRSALKPFADNAEVWEPNENHFIVVYCRRGVKGKPDLKITVGDLFAAYDALDSTKPTNQLTTTGEHE